MDLSTSQIDGIDILSISGRMDATTVDEFTAEAKRLVDDGRKNLLVDFAGLKYISSAGLRGILILSKAAKAAGARVAFCTMQPMVAEVFRISGFAGIMAIHATRDDALAAMRG